MSIPRVAPISYLSFTRSSQISIATRPSADAELDFLARKVSSSDETAQQIWRHIRIAPGEIEMLVWHSKCKVDPVDSFEVDFLRWEGRSRPVRVISHDERSAAAGNF